MMGRTRWKNGKAEGEKGNRKWAWNGNGNMEVEEGIWNGKSFLGIAYYRVDLSFPPTLDANVCNAVHKVYWGREYDLNISTDVSAHRVVPAILWLCLYALFQGEKKYRSWLITGFLLLYAAPIVTLGAVYRSGFKVLMIVAVAVIFKRWRGHHGGLISAIRREGVLYYLQCAQGDEAPCIVLNLLYAVASIRLGMDPYDVFGVCFLPIFADRLMLTLREVNDPGLCASIAGIILDVKFIPADRLGESTCVGEEIDAGRTQGSGSAATL
ncbi:hypothetical protein DFP72DRAFT_848002 [Ephemerocybe angulata]|uniref:Uncharacterized protein n=1 Tax=Ephemerocybe angulata TaxID=980116 RepID=A0A8H6HGV6_9AGAR|nr:hypothetical protein DFP72DRAFT_855151 [Tulosesus angulatus]KAF6755052.1 hypothetical protein DFP72DRAFT_848002 [Tulosesus angulatus]